MARGVGRRAARNLRGALRLVRGRDARDEPVLGVVLAVLGVVLAVIGSLGRAGGGLNVLVDLVRAARRVALRGELRIQRLVRLLDLGQERLQPR